MLILPLPELRVELSIRTPEVVAAVAIPMASSYKGSEPPPMTISPPVEEIAARLRAGESTESEDFAFHVAVEGNIPV